MLRASRPPESAYRKETPYQWFSWAAHSR